jgi:rhodanese-related sulfurtransferase
LSSALQYYNLQKGKTMAKQEALDNGVLVSLTPHEVKEQFDANKIVLIDVRTPAEYAFEHIPGAMLLPLSSFNPAKLPQQDAKPIIFHCGSGLRSAMAAKKCIAAGFGAVTHLEGGFGAWKKAGLSFMTIDPTTGGAIEKVIPPTAS